MVVVVNWRYRLIVGRRRRYRWSGGDLRGSGYGVVVIESSELAEVLLLK